jgi:hypothetical protein
MASAAFLVYEGMTEVFQVKYIEAIALILSILVAVIVYFCFMIFTRTVSEEELLEFPMGRRIADIIKKTGFKL